MAIPKEWVCWVEAHEIFLNRPYSFLVVTWIASICNLLASIAALYTVASILSRRDVRSNAFNLYVAALLFPDSINALANFLSGYQRIKGCGGITEALGDFYDINVFFYYICNFSLNVAVAWELNRMLEQAMQISRAGPPPRKRTILIIAGAYTFALLFAIWGMIDVPWSWYYFKRHQFGSPPGGWFTEMQSMCFVATLMIAFIVSVIACRVRVWWKGMLPRKGRTRVASLFFERIVVVFLAFYFPTLGLLLMTSVIGFSYSSTYFWIERSLQFLTALQVFVTLWVVAQKPDIRSAMRCRGGCCRKPVEGSRSSYTFRTATARSSVFGLASRGSTRFAAPPLFSHNLDGDDAVELVSGALVSGTFVSPVFLDDAEKESEWDMDDEYGTGADDESGSDVTLPAGSSPVAIDDSGDAPDEETGGCAITLVDGNNSDALEDVPDEETGGGTIAVVDDSKSDTADEEIGGGTIAVVDDSKSDASEDVPDEETGGGAIAVVQDSKSDTADEEIGGGTIAISDGSEDVSSEGTGDGDRAKVVVDSNNGDGLQTDGGGVKHLFASTYVQSPIGGCGVLPPQTQIPK